jgi:arginine N-succinyltransferase
VREGLTVYLLRPAAPGDLEAILELARFLQSPNLPADRESLRARLERSRESFATPAPPDASREYQFALVDLVDRVVGTCAILAKHGTPGMPHVYLAVGEEERASGTAGVRLRHRTFQLGDSTDGPTELGALVLHPSLRGAPGSPGKLLSWGRFAYIARHPGCFERRVLAEMRASLDPDGRSAFWDAFGRRFTGMSYAEADRRSACDKSFILDLFPRTPFYATLLPEPVERELGMVHPDARPALRLLEQAGLRWIGEIDPFDAGPFYGAATEDLVPVRETVQGSLAAEAPGADARRWIAHREGCPGFRAVVTPAERESGEVRIGKEARKRLGACVGDEVWLTPLPPARDAAAAPGADEARGG